MTNTETISIEQTIDMLNELVNLDRNAVLNLIINRVPCNQGIADHYSVQIQREDDGSFSVGLMGVINGLFGINAYGAGNIRYVLQNGELIRFERNPLETLIDE